jgi:hypothetical protein
VTEIPDLAGIRSAMTSEHPWDDTWLNPGEMTALLDYTEALVAELRDLEWSANDGPNMGTENVCPSCYCHPHEAGCSVDALLPKVPSAP